jgi:LPXTG-motif cell wall-anchored protein
VDTSDESGSGGSGGTTTTSAAGASSTATLPKTGGADALPVVGLWALALMMLGSAALLLVQRRTRPEQ